MAILDRRSKPVYFEPVNARMNGYRYVIALVFLVSLPAFGQIPGVTINPLNFFEGKPTKLTAGPDGNIYFTDNTNQSVDKLAINFLPPSLYQKTVTKWAIGPSLPQVGLPATAQVSPLAITSTADAVWFSASASGKSILGKVTPDGTMTLVPIPGETVNATAMIATPDGTAFYLAFANGAPTLPGALHVARVTTQGTETLISTPHDCCFAFTVGPDQNVYGNARTGYIERLSGGVKEWQVTSPALPFYSGLAFGSDGKLYYNAFSCDGCRGIASQFGQLDVATGKETLFPIGNNDFYIGGITRGADGNVWAVDHFKTKVARFDVTAGTIAIQDGGRSGTGTDIVPISSNGLNGFIGNFFDPSGFGDLDFIGALAGEHLPPDLMIEKTATVGDAVPPRTKVTFHITVVNLRGSGVTTGPLVIDDALPAGFLLDEVPLPSVCSVAEPAHRLTCTFTNPFPPNSGIDIDIRGTIDLKATVKNQATVSTPGEINLANNTSATVTVSGSAVDSAGPALVVSKQKVTVLGKDAWRVTVINRGGPTNGPITVTDVAPTGVKWQPFGELSDRDVVCSATTDTITCTVKRVLGKGEPITLPDFYPEVFPRGTDVMNVATVTGGGAPSTPSRPAWTTPVRTIPVTDPPPQPTNGREE